MIRRLMLALLACLAVAGCADSGDDSNNHDGRFGGFYTGGNIGGGMAR